MHRIQEVYKCKCDRCNGEWVTKEKRLPDRCAKCNCKNWDTTSKTVAPIETPETVEPIHEHRFTDVAMNPALDQFLAKHAAIEPIVVETVEDWQFKKGEKPDYNTDTGRTFRKQYLMPAGRVTRTVRVDDEEIDVIISVVGK